MPLRIHISSLPVLLASGLMLATSVLPEPSASATSHAQSARNFGKLPLSFEANKGQADPRVSFLSRDAGYSLYLTGRDAVLVLGGARNDSIRMRLAGMPVPSIAHAGASQATGEDELPGKVNYFIGSDPAKWRIGLPTYAKVRYKGVYPGVDLVYYGNRGQLEYDFVVAPGTSASTIRLQFTGEKRLHIAANGDLVLEGMNGSAMFRKPIVYQEKGGQREAVNGSFRLVARSTIGFALGPYDRSLPLVIDPVLTYSTYLGGPGTCVPAGFSSDLYCNGSTSGNAIAIDSDGNAYVTGYTNSEDFPTSLNAFQRKNRQLSDASPGIQTGWGNAFVTKLNAKGNAIVYSTYLGGANASIEEGNAIAVDDEGNAYVGGVTSSPNFPTTTRAFQPKRLVPALGQEGFVTKLNPDGSALVYSTYLSGAPDLCGGIVSGIALDSAHHVYATGYTCATNFPTTHGAFQTENKGAMNGFVTKLDAAGTALVYSTYLGGSGVDKARGIAVDTSGRAFVVGSTGSANFPITPDAFQNKNYALGNNPENSTGFVAKLNSDGTALEYSTYLGGSYEDEANAVAVDAEGDFFVAGQAASGDFPVTPGAFETILPWWEPFYSPPTVPNAFVTKFNSSGTGLVYSTFLGGANGSTSDGDHAYSIVLDSAGNAIVGGYAQCTDFPSTPNAYQTTNPQGGAAFITRLNAAGNGLLYSTFLNGEEDGENSTGSGIAIDAHDNVYVVGSTLSINFPVTPGAFETKLMALSVAFVSKLALAPYTTLKPTTITLTAKPDETYPGEAVTFTAHVAPVSGSAAPTGTVAIQVLDDYFATLKANGGSFTFTPTSQGPGQYEYIATYSGDANYSPSQGGTNVLVDLPPPAPNAPIRPKPSPITSGAPRDVAASVGSSDWVWMSGSHQFDMPGVYGTIRATAAGNIPGSREAAANWTDRDGNLWLFGGYGAAADATGFLNDLWRFDPTTAEWTWVSGSSKLGCWGCSSQQVHGSRGVATAANVPGGRYSASSWTDSLGHFWLFGGYGPNYARAALWGELNDLWEFNPATNEWIWWGGLPNNGVDGVYGKLGVSAPANYPGAREAATAWTDSHGNLWLFGGLVNNSAPFNDLWKFDPTTHEWTWVSGSSTGGNCEPACGLPGVYGKLGVPSAKNVPGGRSSSSGSTDSQGNLWLFGGFGYDSQDKGGYLNDFWRFDPSTGEWAWMSGSNMRDGNGVYGKLGVAAAANTPGGRASPSTWTDKNGNLWIFGGYSVDSTNDPFFFDDLWMFSPLTKEWAWMGGSNSVGPEGGRPGVYGMLRVPAAGDHPGGRLWATSWTDKSGDPWLFGGVGFDSSGYEGSLSDLWEYLPVPAKTASSATNGSQ